MYFISFTIHYCYFTIKICSSLILALLGKVKYRIFLPGNLQMQLRKSPRLRKFSRVMSTKRTIEINGSRYIALFVVSGSVKKFFPTDYVNFSIDYVNIYVFAICCLIDFTQWKNVWLLHIVYIINH